MLNKLNGIAEQIRINAQSILGRAMVAVRERDKTHGNPEEVHRRAADLWTAYLRYNVTAKDVAIMQAMLKIARGENGTYNPDDWIDAAGYMALAGAAASRSANVPTLACKITSGAAVAEQIGADKLAKAATILNGRVERLSADAYLLDGRRVEPETIILAAKLAQDRADNPVRAV